jgi:predicted transposase/invertase (TIGR01784 family)
LFEKQKNSINFALIRNVQNKNKMSTTLTDRYINFFTDYGFKRLFGEERNKDLLIDFLNTLLKGKEDIKTLNYKKTEYLGSTSLDRKAIFDLYCENEKGEKFIIELQKAKQNFFRDRTIFYSTFPIQEQAQRGDWDFELKNVYTIGILDFRFNDDDKDKTVVNEIKLMDTKTKKVFYDKLTYIYLQMPNFTKKVTELENHFDKWLYAMKNLHDLEGQPEVLSGVFEKFFNEAEIANYTEEEVKAYENSLKYYRDLKNTLDTAKDEGRKEGEKIGIEKGEKIGIEKGEKIGVEKGEKIGIEKGEKIGELRNQIKTALEMIKENMEDQLIHKFTGLPVETIAQIRQFWIEKPDITPEEVIDKL